MQKRIKMIANWKSILIIFIILLCIQTPSFAVTEVELQWYHSIDEPYLTSYKIYYDTDSRDVDPYDQTPKATHYSLNGTDWDLINNNDPVTVDKDVTQIFLRFSDETLTYFFAVTAVDTRGLESDPSNEVCTLGITSITSSTDNGSYNEGDAINITITFSEAVTLAGGNLIVTLDTTGGTAEITPFGPASSASGTYTVGAGENTNALNVQSITFSGALQNLDPTPVILTSPLSLPEGSNLKDNNSIVIDTIAPTVAISYSEPGPYRDADADTITVTATFTEANAIAGTPQIAIDYAGDGSDVSATNMTEVSNKVWTYSMNVPAGNDGTTTITITGADNAGNAVGAHSGQTFIVDNIPPITPAIDTNSGNDYSTTNSDITLEGTCAADTVAIYVNSSTDGVTYTVNATTWQYYSGTLESGENTFNITAKDVAGNVSNVDSITVTYSSITSVPPEIVEVIPHDGAGIDDTTRVPNNTSFGVRIEDSDGIDITNTDSIIFTINDGVNDEYTRDLSDTTVVRRVKLDDAELDTAVTKLWAVYDRSNEGVSPPDPVYLWDADITIKVDAKDKNGEEMTQASYNFRIESETEHDEAQSNLPDTGAVDPADSALGGSYDAGIQVNSGDLEGAKIVYDSSEAVTPTLGPSDEIPTFDYSGADAVGVPMNLQPPTVFTTTPVKIFIPCPGYTDVSDLSIFMYNGTSWVLACDADGNVQAGGDGWMVAGSRVDHNDTDPPTIEIQVYHFSGVQAGLLSSDISASGGGCFIATAAYGSPLDKHVNVLRHLRDDILLPNKWGQGFVKTYYRYSPSVADFIRDHDTARLMARWSLLPVIGLSWVALQIGAVPTLLLIFMVLSMGWLFLIKYKGLRHRVKVQEELLILDVKC